MIVPRTDAGAIDESHVIAGKSQRKRVSHLKLISTLGSSIGCCV